MLNVIKNKRPNMRRISKETGFAYPLVREVMKQFEDEKLIEPVFNRVDFEGRDYNITLTGKGEQITKMLIDIAQVSGEMI